jgi:hypothetical protein
MHAPPRRTASAPALLGVTVPAPVQAGVPAAINVDDATDDDDDDDDIDDNHFVDNEAIANAEAPDRARNPAEAAARLREESAIAIVTQTINAIINTGSAEAAARLRAAPDGDQDGADGGGAPVPAVVVLAPAVGAQPAVAAAGAVSAAPAAEVLMDALGWIKEHPTLALKPHGVARVGIVRHSPGLAGYEPNVNADKVANNVAFAKAVAATEGPGRILVLDGETAGTTGAVRDVGVQEPVDIIECVDAFADRAYATVKERNLANVNVVFGQLKTFLNAAAIQHMRYVSGVAGAQIGVV